MKILCLHGYTQNKSLFARKTSALRKSLSKLGHELTFIDGPLQVEQSELSYTVEDNKNMRSWWVFKEGDPEQYRLDHAFDTVQEAIDHHGPFDGLMGFSQGAGLVGVLCNYWPRLQPDHPLRFAIMFAGFKLKYPGAEIYYEEEITTPTLHVVGSLDNIVDGARSEALYECCNKMKRWKVQHPGGHVVPGRRDMLDQVASFIQQEAKPAEPAEPAEAEEAAEGAKEPAEPAAEAEEADADSDDQFDAIGRA